MELVTTKICMALDLGVHGNLFGGNMMSFLDEAAAAYACQICDSAKMVTKKIEEVVFESPVKVGNLIKIYASVDRFGSTSISINLEARKHNVHTGKQELVCSTKMVFVKLDEEGSPIPISDRVKIRYAERFEKYGRGLLHPEEMEKEQKEKKMNESINIR
jgi:acyl-CoA thioesterase YciA